MFLESYSNFLLSFTKVVWLLLFKDHFNAFERVKSRTDDFQDFSKIFDKKCLLVFDKNATICKNQINKNRAEFKVVYKCQISFRISQRVFIKIITD